MTGKPIKFYSNEEVKEVLNEIIQTEPGIDNLSQAVRFAVLKYKKMSSEKRETQLNAMSKELSIVAEIVSSQSENMVTPIIPREENSKFEDAKKIVEARIQKNKTKQMKYSTKSEKVSMELPTDNYFLNQF